MIRLIIAKTPDKFIQMLKLGRPHPLITVSIHQSYLNGIRSGGAVDYPRTMYARRPT